MDELTKVTESVKSAHHRIDNIEEEVKDIRKLTEAVIVTAEKVDNLKSDVSELKGDVKSITERPGKMWDKISSAAIGALVTGMVAAALALILK